MKNRSQPQRDQSKCDALHPWQNQPKQQRLHHTGHDNGNECGADSPTHRLKSDTCEVSPDGEKHGVAKGEQTRHPQNQIITKGVNGQYKHFNEQALYKFSVARVAGQHIGRGLPIQQSDQKGEDE